MKFNIGLLCILCVILQVTADPGLFDSIRTAVRKGATDIGNFFTGGRFSKKAEETKPRVEASKPKGPKIEIAPGVYGYASDSSTGQRGAPVPGQDLGIPGSIGQADIPRR
ncbi:hypothetical protein K7432_015869 [Basidiobolus ranarum]|uniref:Uncharacterized protein n=1 Tax=Basidiobolus ranarum TaxID=34480 RepID=A0ABR2WFJ1_9FUNG